MIHEKCLNAKRARIFFIFFIIIIIYLFIVYRINGHQQQRSAPATRACNVSSLAGRGAGTVPGGALSSQ